MSEGLRINCGGMGRWGGGRDTLSEGVDAPGGQLMGDVPVLYKSTFIALAFGLVFG